MENFNKNNIFLIDFDFNLEDNLVIHDKWARTANVFIFAAGGSGKCSRYFGKNRVKEKAVRNTNTE